MPFCKYHYAKSVFLKSSNRENTFIQFLGVQYSRQKVYKYASMLNVIRNMLRRYFQLSLRHLLSLIPKIKIFSIRDVTLKGLAIEEYQVSALHIVIFTAWDLPGF